MPALCAVQVWCWCYLTTGWRKTILLTLGNTTLVLMGALGFVAPKLVAQFRAEQTWVDLHWPGMGFGCPAPHPTSWLHTHSSACHPAPLHQDAFHPSPPCPSSPPPPPCADQDQLVQLTSFQGPQQCGETSATPCAGFASWHICNTPRPAQGPCTVPSLDIVHI